MPAGISSNDSGLGLLHRTWWNRGGTGFEAVGNRVVGIQEDVTVRRRRPYARLVFEAWPYGNRAAQREA